jgi:hypothetical protein
MWVGVKAPVGACRRQFACRGAGSIWNAVGASGVAMMKWLALLGCASTSVVGQTPQQRVWAETLDAVVEEYSSTNVGPAGMTTYRLSIDLKENVGAASVYKIYGSATSPMSFPVAYHLAGTFGSDIGGTDPAFWSFASSDQSGYAEFDSFLTIGITGGDPTGILLDEQIDWDAWTESSGLSTSVGSVSWVTAVDSLSQTSTTTDPVVVAQLTVATGTVATATAGVQGCSSTGCVGSDAWMADGVTFSIGAPNPTCDAFTCPDGDVIMADASTITCAGATCTAAECCNPACGDMDNAAFPLSDCAAGMVLKSYPLSIGCPSGTCTSDDCCEATTTEATPPQVQNCEGSWSMCAEDCANKTYIVTTPVAAGGAECEAADGDTVACLPGDGDCVDKMAAVPDEDSGSGGVIIVVVVLVVVASVAIAVGLKPSAGENEAGSDTTSTSDAEPSKKTFENPMAESDESDGSEAEDDENQQDEEAGEDQFDLNSQPQLSAHDLAAVSLK